MEKRYKNIVFTILVFIAVLLCLGFTYRTTICPKQYKNHCEKNNCCASSTEKENSQTEGNEKCICNFQNISFASEPVLLKKTTDLSFSFIITGLISDSSVYSAYHRLKEKCYFNTAHPKAWCSRYILSRHCVLLN